jgi:hypothetical protein
MWITANLWNDFQKSFLASHTQAGAIVATSPQITTGIEDTNGNQIIGLSPTGSAVNQITVADAATGNAPTISATGSDTNINLNLVSKGTGVVQANGNPVWQYLGYAQITSGFSTALGSSIQVPGISVAVTVPAGATKVKVTLGTFGLSTSSTTGYLTYNVWDGTVGIGTEIGGAQAYIGIGGGISPANPVAIQSSPSSGSHTYNAGFSTSSGGTSTVNASSSVPAFILVECC